MSALDKLPSDPEGRLIGAAQRDARVPPVPTACETRPVPQRLGSYVIKGILGEGGMGVVYEAQQENPPRAVAVKVIRGGQYVDENRLRLFQREAAALARLKHPYIGGSTRPGVPRMGSTSSPWN